MGKLLTATQQGSPKTKQYYSHSPSLSVHCCCCCSPPRRLPSFLSPPPLPHLLRILCGSVVIFSLTFFLAFSSVEGIYKFHVYIPRQDYQIEYDFSLANNCIIIDVFTAIEKRFGKEYDLFHTYLRWHKGGLAWPKVKMYYLSHDKLSHEWVPHASASLATYSSIESAVSLEAEWRQPVDRMILNNCTRKPHSVNVNSMDLVIRSKPLTVVMVTSTQRDINIPAQSFFIPGNWSQINIDEVLKTYTQCLEEVTIPKHRLASLRVAKMMDKLTYNENIPLTIEVVPRVDTFSFSSQEYNNVQKLYEAVNLSVHRPMFSQSAELRLEVDWRPKDLCVPQGPRSGARNYAPWIRLCYNDCQSQKVPEASLKYECLCFRGLPTKKTLEIGIKYASCRMMGSSFGRSMYFGESEDIVKEILLQQRRIPCVSTTTWTEKNAKIKKQTPMPSSSFPYFPSSTMNDTRLVLRTAVSKEKVRLRRKSVILNKAIDFKAAVSEKTHDFKAAFSQKSDRFKASVSEKTGQLKTAFSEKTGDLKTALSGKKNKHKNASEALPLTMKLDKSWTYETGTFPELGILPFFESLNDAKNRDDIERDCPDLCIHFEFVS